VTNLFYDILYYDSYRPFITTCIILLAMSAVFLLARHRNAEEATL